MKKSENSFCKRFRTLRIFWEQNRDLAFFGDVGGMSAWCSLGNTRKKIFVARKYLKPA